MKEFLNEVFSSILEFMKKEKLIDERKCTILSLRIVEEKTFKDIGVLYNLSGERIKQLFMLGQKKFKNGIEKILLEASQSNKSAFVRKSNQLNTLLTSFIDKATEMGKFAELVQKQKLALEGGIETDNSLAGQAIETLGLSQRSLVCLKYHDNMKIKTDLDIAKCSEKELSLI